MPVGQRPRERTPHTEHECRRRFLLPVSHLSSDSKSLSLRRSLKSTEVSYLEGTLSALGGG
jgi:hypothetical protein